jgi:mRNA interferase HigB
LPLEAGLAGQRINIAVPVALAGVSRATLAISQYEIYSEGVHVITRKRLREFAARHREAAEPLGVWYAIMSRTDFRSFAELKRMFRSVDKVGKFTVFDIGGNKFRLIAAIHYNRKKVYIRHVLTHVEYDSDKWKE